MFQCFVITLFKWMKYKNRLTFAYYSKKFWDFKSLLSVPKTWIFISRPPANTTLPPFPCYISLNKKIFYQNFVDFLPCLGELLLWKRFICHYIALKTKKYINHLWLFKPRKWNNRPTAYWFLKFMLYVQV